jgi:hypothetical protein
MSVNCGVLFYAHAPDGELNFLLGQEAFIDGYAASGEWSAFEGGQKPGETYDETAIRECCEESMEEPLTATDIRSAIDKNAVYRATMNLQRKDSPEIVQTRCLLVIQIPYDKEIEKRFEAKRREVLSLCSMLTKYNSSRKTAMKLGLPVVGQVFDGVVVLDIFHSHANQLNEIWIHITSLDGGIVKQKMIMVQQDTQRQKFLREYSQMIRHWSIIKQEVVTKSKIFKPVLTQAGIAATFACNEDCLEKIQVKWVPMKEVVKRLRPCRRTALRIRYKFSVILSNLLNHKDRVTKATPCFSRQSDAPLHWQ